MTPSSVRSALAEHAGRLARQSALRGAWLKRVGEGRAISDGALDRVVAAGHPVDTWPTALKLLMAPVAVALGTGHPLLTRVPAVGGRGVVDEVLDQALTDLWETEHQGMLHLMARMPVANDPRTGVELWRALERVGEAAPEGGELLVIGASAGLELVADDLDESLGWRPTGRRGVDLAPVDVGDDLSARWLLAACPPDDVTRHERTEAAIDVARARGVRVDHEDAVAAITAASSQAPLVVMAASVLCMVEDPWRVPGALAARRGTSWLVDDEVVEVHRMAHNATGLEAREPGERVIRVQRWVDGECTTFA